MAKRAAARYAPTDTNNCDGEVTNTMTPENILLVCVGITAVTVLTCFCLTVSPH